MASWKKVLVSGSAGAFTSVTASSGVAVVNGTTTIQSLTNNPATTSLTGSFSGNGAGLTGVTADFPSVNASSLISTDRIFVGTGSTSDTPSYITYNDFLTDLAGTNLVVESQDSLTLNTTISGLTSVTSTTFTANGGADTIGFIGKITGSNVIGLVLSASHALTASYAENAGGGTLNISASAIGGAGGGNTSISLGTEALVVSGTLNEIEVTANAANNLLQIGLPNNVSIAGNLTVAGTLTSVSASSLIVSDKFILLASSSTTVASDGGIIVQNTVTNNTGSGYGFIMDGASLAAIGSPTPRWGVTSSLSPTAANTTTPDEYMVTVKTTAGTQTAASTAPTYGGDSPMGNGNMVIDSAGDIWIYVY